MLLFELYKLSNLHIFSFCKIIIMAASDKYYEEQQGII